jgi:hypothetical protein
VLSSSQKQFPEESKLLKYTVLKGVGEASMCPSHGELRSQGNRIKSWESWRVS